MTVDYTRPGNAQPHRQHQQARPAPAVDTAPGWYADPFKSGQRWWDGTEWTRYVAATPRPVAAGSRPTTVVSNSTVVAIGRQKSAGVALVLTFLFGPLGMLYSTVLGAVMMTLVTAGGAVVIGTVTLGVGDLFWVPLCWVLCMIWGCAAASGSGTHLVATQATHQHN